MQRSKSGKVYPYSYSREGHILLKWIKKYDPDFLILRFTSYFFHQSNTNYFFFALFNFRVLKKVLHGGVDRWLLYTVTCFQAGSKVMNYLGYPIYPTPPLGQNMTQGQFLSGVLQVLI